MRADEETGGRAALIIGQAQTASGKTAIATASEFPAY
jgi:hypothetical protein